MQKSLTDMTKIKYYSIQILREKAIFQVGIKTNIISQNNKIKKCNY